MKLEEQVTSLELSKKLRELGVKQESLFHWFCPDGDAEPRVCWHHWCEPGYIRHYSAFTVAELIEISNPYKDIVIMRNTPDFVNKTASELIHLIEEGIINTDE